MNKQNVVYPYNGILFATTWMNLENIMLSNRSQSQKTVQCCMISYIWKFRMGKSLETENRLVVAQGWVDRTEVKGVIAKGYESLSFSFFFLINLFVLFIYFWLRWVFVATCRLSQVAASRGYSSLWCTGFLLQWLLVAEHGLQAHGLQQLWLAGSRAQAQQLWLTGSRAQAQQLWRMGLVAPWHVGSSLTRARTCVPCIGRWILNHCATGEAQGSFLR